MPSMPSSSTKKTHRPRDKEKPRFYLLPGQGGSNYRRKQKFIIKSSLAVGAIVSAILALGMYLASRTPR